MTPEELARYANAANCSDSVHGDGMLGIVRFSHGIGGSFSDHTLLGHILGVP